MVQESRKLTQQFEEKLVVRNFRRGFRFLFRDRITAVYLTFLTLVIVLAVIGPSIAPYPADENIYHNGELARTLPPSVQHPLGTTPAGHDVLSRIIIGARPTAITGLLGGTMIITIGMTIGITAGYIGGRVDSILMRFTDLIYGVPLLPFAIVLVSLLGVGFIKSIVVIGLILWRGSARVLRSQVLQIKERPFILELQAQGASTSRIVLKHIFPNIAGMAVFFFALGIGYTIIIQAGLAFLGVASPFVPSWGVILRNAYQSGMVSEAWWWSIPPGLMISFVVLSTMMVGRKLEAGGEEQTDKALTQMG